MPLISFNIYGKGRGFRRGVLEYILYFSRTEDSVMFPTDERLVYKELIYAVQEYVSGKEADVKKSLPYDDRGFEGKLWDGLQEVLTESKKIKGLNKLNEKVEDALSKLLEPKWKSGIMGDSSCEPELYRHYQIGYGPAPGRTICEIDKCIARTFSLPEHILLPLSRNIQSIGMSYPAFSNVQGIGNLMRKYIERDLQGRR